MKPTFTSRSAIATWSRQFASTGETAEAVDLEANFLVIRTMQEGDMMIFAAGRYVDRVVRVGEEWKFARKEVVLDSRQIDTLLAIPI